MNQYKKINSFLLIAAFSLCWTACFNDLDTIPIDPDEITAATVYDDPSAYKQVLAKLYAGLAVTGQEGPSGQSDISGIDEGFGQYIRAFWHHQTLTTEEAVVGWNDQTIQDFHNHNWDANDTFIAAFYYRIFYQVSVCNEFLRETTDEKLTERSVDAALREEIQTFRAEARFLRALSYWHALDHFRNVPFVTENDPVGSFFPPQTNANDLFNYIESELLAIEDQMLTPQSEYGRADQAAAWILLAKLYLNAEVYVDQDKATEALTYCNKILGAGYRLDDNYEHLFMADNHLSSEIIFPVIYDGVNTRTWGGTTFLTRAGLGGNMIPSDFGVLSGWGGIRVTSALVNKFPTVAGQSGGLIVEPGESEDHPFINMPGTYSNWAQADENTRLSSPDDNGVYEGYIWFEAPTDFRIIENESLLTSYGDAGSGNLVLNGGGNIQIPSAGFYRIEVDLNNLTYSLERTEWGLIGSATPGGWDADTEMTYNAQSGAWEVELPLVAGAIKFRANGAWDINLGDREANSFLEQDGDDILIESNGNYRIQLFLRKPDYTYSVETTSFDGRAIFHTDGQNLEIANISEFTDGYASKKFKNINRDGSAGSSPEHPDTDFPMFRLGDVYLMYAEAVLRNGTGGDRATALGYINDLRRRAYGDDAGIITDGEMDLDFILDERARELFWECHRRTDLIRFGRFSASNYVWPWKGGIPEGVSTSEHLDLFPIPAADIGANPELSQNQGY